MLTAFLDTNRQEILTRARTQVGSRAAPRPTQTELQNGLPLFLDHLITALGHPLDAPTDAIGNAATKHGSDMVQSGFSVSQVVHDYGDLCQAITQVADEREAAISNDEFRTLNGCLDNAIALAVTEFERQREQVLAVESGNQLGVLVREMRNRLNVALLAFDLIQTGSVGVSGSTAAVVTRSLIALRDLVDRSFADVRLRTGAGHPEPIVLADLIEEVCVGTAIVARHLSLDFSVAPVDAAVQVYADRQNLSSALGNVLQNALESTPRRGRVVLSTRATADRVLIEIADECGGLPPGEPEELCALFAPRGADRSGLGVGLAITRHAVEECGGVVHVQNHPGKGCTFVVDLPKHSPAAS
ncbi:MAG: HAMP domain-containing sensor histidine kinase [bacterium]